MRGREELASAAVLDAAAGWGATVKRVQVQLGPDAPPLVCAKAGEPVIEVVKQCATLERLLDALAWRSAQTRGSANMYS